MTLTEYILLPRAERTAHIDMTTPCQIRTRKRNGTRQVNGQVFRDMLTANGITRDVGNLKTAGINLCHLCEEKNCINTLHCYIGTAKENQNDKTPEQRAEASRRVWAERTATERKEIGRKISKRIRTEQRVQTAKEIWKQKSEQERREAALKISKAVQLTELETGRTYHYSSIREAAQTHSLQEGCISQVCKGRRKQTGGYLCEYTEERQ